MRKLEKRIVKIIIGNNSKNKVMSETKGKEKADFKSLLSIWLLELSSEIVV